MELKDWLIRLMPEIVRTVVWTIPLIVGTIMVRRGGKRPEQSFLAGSGLIVLDQLVTMVKRVHTQLIMTARLGLDPEGIKALYLYVNSVGLVYSVFTSLFFLAGMVLLVYAFWYRFAKKVETPVGDSTI